MTGLLVFVNRLALHRWGWRALTVLSLVARALGHLPRKRTP